MERNAPITVPLNPQPGPIVSSASGIRAEKMQGRSMPIRLEVGLERNVQPDPMRIVAVWAFLNFMRP